MLCYPNGVVCVAATAVERGMAICREKDTYVRLSDITLFKKIFDKMMSYNACTCTFTFNMLYTRSITLIWRMY